MKLNQNEKAIITLDLPEEERPVEKRRGIIEPPPPPDYLARRLRINLPYLNVFDFARFADGSDSGFFTKETLTASTTTGPIPLSGRPDAFSRLLATYRDAVLAYDPDDLKNTFLKITEVLDDYNCSITNFTNYVEDKGLLSPTNETNIFLSAPTNEYFINWSTRKITASPSFASSSVTYVHDKKADLFLTPHFWGWEGRATMNTSGGFPKTDYEMYDMFKPLPRVETINVADWDSIWTDRASTGTWTSGQRDFFRSIVMDDADSEYVQFDRDGVGGSYPVTTYPGTNFPSVTDTLPAGRGWENSPKIGLFGGIHSTGFLTAIIVKYTSPVEYYYVWTNSVWVVGNSFDIGANDTLVVI